MVEPVEDNELLIPEGFEEVFASLIEDILPQLDDYDCPEEIDDELIEEVPFLEPGQSYTFTCGSTILSIVRRDDKLELIVLKR